MPETLLERHYRDRVQSVEQMLLRKSANGTRAPEDYRDLVALCLELATAGISLMNQEHKRVFQEPHPTVRWLRERRQAIEELCKSFLVLAASVREIVGQLPDTAYADRQTQLDNAMRAVSAARDDVLRRWVVGSDEEIAAAQAAAARGEGVDVDEAFAQIAGVDVGTWRRRIEEFERQA